MNFKFVFGSVARCSKKENEMSEQYPWDWSRTIAEGTYGHYDKEREDKEKSKERLNEKDSDRGKAA